VADLSGHFTQAIAKKTTQFMTASGGMLSMGLSSALTALVIAAKGFIDEAKNRG
jgi:hypothetical protein